MHASNFRPVKRTDDVVRVFARVQELIPARLVLIGDGPQLRKTQQLVSDLNLSDKVHFLGEQDQLEPLLSCADLFLLPSEQESFGLTALEAMNCGVPVIATDIGGLPELVAHGETGYLFPIGETERMAEAAADLLQRSRATRTIREEGEGSRRPGLQREPDHSPVRGVLRGSSAWLDHEYHRLDRDGRRSRFRGGLRCLEIARKKRHGWLHPGEQVHTLVHDHSLDHGHPGQRHHLSLRSRPGLRGRNAIRAVLSGASDRHGDPLCHRGSAFPQAQGVYGLRIPRAAFRCQEPHAGKPPLSDSAGPGLRLHDLRPFADHLRPHGVGYPPDDPGDRRTGDSLHHHGRDRCRQQDTSSADGDHHHGDGGGVCHDPPPPASRHLLSGRHQGGRENGEPERHQLRL